MIPQYILLHGFPLLLNSDSGAVADGHNSLLPPHPEGAL